MTGLAALTRTLPYGAAVTVPLRRIAFSPMVVLRVRDSHPAPAYGTSGRAPNSRAVCHARRGPCRMCATATVSSCANGSFYSYISRV
jgi:hypothetical protein